MLSISSKISHVSKSSEELETVRKVSVVSLVDMNVNSHLHTVSFTWLSCADENPTNPVLDEDNGSLNVVSANLPDELILTEDNKILIIHEQIEEEQFLHYKQGWRKEQLKSFDNATLNPSLPPED